MPFDPASPSLGSLPACHLEQTVLPAARPALTCVLGATVTGPRTRPCQVAAAVHREACLGSETAVTPRARLPDCCFHSLLHPPLPVLTPSEHALPSG